MISRCALLVAPQVSGIASALVLVAAPAVVETTGPQVTPE